MAACRILLIILAVTVAVAAAADEPTFVVVAHGEVPVDAISTRELRRIYLGKSTRWEGGQAIRPVMLEGGPVLEAFVTEALDRTEESFSVYWKRMVFTGKGRPPLTFATVDELAFYVRMTPGAIGFLSADADRTELKVIRVD
jgi:ABC-type phosphate transport system substrate-binding protein